MNVLVISTVQKNGVYIVGMYSLEVQIRKETIYDITW